MATARAIPPGPEAFQPQQITITSTGASPKACIIADGQPVTFINNTGGVININFQPDATPGMRVFNNVSNLSWIAPNNTNTQTPQLSNRTVNFNTDGSSNYPYAIQVGAGPLYVLVTYNGTQVNCYPSPAVIPYGGTIELYKNSGDQNNYSVTWPTPAGDPFTPPLTRVDNTPHTDSANIADYEYKVALANPVAATGQGGGTVKVKGS